MVDMLGLAAPVVCCVSLLFGILALSLNSWMVNTCEESSVGLWEYCQKYKCTEFSGSASRTENALIGNALGSASSDPMKAENGMMNSLGNALGSASSGANALSRFQPMYIAKQDTYNAVKAVLFLAILALAGAVGCAVLKKDVLQLLAGVLAFAAGLFLMIGFAVFAGELKMDGYKYGTAFALDVVAWLLAWVAGGLFVAPKFLNTTT